MILSQVRKTIEKYQMLAPGHCVIVGVSGGADSVALLSVLKRLSPVYGISLVVAHLNHRLRGRESGRDEVFVKKLARKLGLPFEVSSVQAKQFRRKGMTLQEAAREARFLFFDSLVEKHGAHKIALGQTADDQAETIVMRFIRGAGLPGLKGIPPVRDDVIIHPLIEVRRVDVEAYLAQEGLSYVEDSSNRKEIYLRNRIRSHLIPILEGYNPNLKTRLGKMGHVLLQDEEYLRATTDENWNRAVQHSGDSVCLDLTHFGNLHPALQLRVLKRSVESVSGDSSKRIGITHILSLTQLAMGGTPHAVIHLPGGISARRTYDRLEIGKGERPPPPLFDHGVLLPGVTLLEEIDKKLVTEFVDDWNLEDASSLRVYADLQRLETPLRARNYRHGDRFRPLGMARSQKKIKDCFIDWKTPKEERSRTPLVVSGDTIVWVVGYRISEDVRLTEKTVRAVRMEVQDL
jgi:tRNA(Ile)-lysidine synthase